MTPAARLQATIDLLAEIIAILPQRAGPPADRVVADWFRQRRYIGAKDRTAIHARLYRILRRWARLNWWLEQAGQAVPEAMGAFEQGRARVLVLAEGVLASEAQAGEMAAEAPWRMADIAALWEGSRYGPAPLTRAEEALARHLVGQRLDHPAQPQAVALEYPAWLEPALQARFGDRLEAEMAAMRGPASVDLRLNPLHPDIQAAGDPASACTLVLKALAAEGIAAEASPLSPWGLRLAGRPALQASAVFKQGLVEIQDEGSQLVALLAEARPGQQVVDFCAGAGGKTLALAAGMHNRGRLIACDVSEGRLEAAVKRLRRAGVHNVERRLLRHERDPWVKRHKGGFDRVLVDAPCSGSGTWRRNPDARWGLSQADLAELTDVQGRLLESTARLVKPGGRLIYATCSFLAAENQDRIEAFLATHPGFALLPVQGLWPSCIGTALPDELGQTLSLTPALHGTDGFFCAVLERQTKAALPDPAAGDPSADREGA